MRKKLIISVMILCNIAVFAQNNDNPYSMFGYEPKVSDVTYSETELFYLHNTDTAALVQVLAFDFESGIAILYNANNQIITDLFFDKETMARFTTPDPLAEKFPNISPYAFCNNNPINAIDPDGRSTYVLNNGDGTYRVVGGSLDDDDLNIYLFSAGKNSELVKTSIGLTTSLTSFYDSDNSQWRGTINSNDNSGKSFLDNFVKDNPEIGYYMDNATTGKKYDFKVSNGTGAQYEKEDFYRGMPVQTQKDGTVVYTSARDVGNIAAGYIAGLYGIPWDMARKKFDALESQQQRRPAVEGISTQNAQRVGWETGMRDGTNNPGVRFFNWINSIPTGFKFLFR